MHHPKKHFGQNFLVDGSVLQQIIACIDPHENEYFMEIGPGKGALTQCLLPLVKQLDVVEIDKDLIQQLEQDFKNKSSLVIHQGDILKFDLTTLFRDGDKIRVVGNLPYNISTPLIFKLFEYAKMISDMHFLLQKEVVLRLTAKVGSSHYGRLSIMAQYYCENFMMLEVGPQAFRPVPKVDSAFIRMVPHAKPRSDVDVENMSLLIKEAFCYRRKTIHNSLKKFVSAQQFEQLAINPQARPQELSLEDYIRISNEVRVR